MAIQVQIREDVLAGACIEFAQAQLFATCALDLSPLLYIDHLDTVAGSAVFTGTQGAITLTLQVAVFVVNGADLAAHVNGVPAGALTPVGDVGVSLSFGIVGTALQIVSITSAPAGLTPPSLQAAAKAVIDTALAPLVGVTIFETAPVVSALSSLVPASPDLARGDGVIAIRFGASGPATSRLAPGQDWGAVLDANEATGLLTDRIPDGLPVNVTWLPNGGKPGIGAEVEIDVNALGIDIASITATANATVSFVAPSSLKVDAFWDIDLSGILSPLEAIARKYVRKYLRELVSEDVPGATNEGAQGFSYTIALPALPTFLKVRPVWGSISSDADGMTIGGPVIAAFRGEREILSATPAPFGRPTWWGHCRQRAQSGDGSPPSHVDAANLTVGGGVSLSYAGALCGRTIQPPNQWLDGFINATIDGVGFSLPTGIAELVASDVQIIVRTARGVRMFDLGKPVITRDASGEIEVQINWYDDCLYLSGVWLKLATGQAVTKTDFVPVPLENPNWMAVLGAGNGVNSHLITITGLEPGEIVTFLGLGLALDVSAGRDGVAVLPAIVGAADAMHEARVQRLSHQPFHGRITIKTVEFTRLATVCAATSATVRDIGGVARVAWRDGDVVRVADYRPNREGAFTPVHGHQATELNPQPLPPGPPESAHLAEAAGLHHRVAAFSLAGFDENKVAVVAVGDGEAVVVVREEGHPRVAGRYSGPLVGMTIDGDFAISKSGGLVHLFDVSRPEATVLEA